ncbi:type IV secretion system protein VirB10 [Gilliamella sp. W8126]|uniref:type IV secretion system protein VirB10 n=1 Tax=Gilliamella sp. W8126 TaxID=2750946 RepID=UPI0018DB72E5|nr:type IV secretion system protein VirB10 [Gilliamella sp. W8126]MBI0006989.1 type IV secretion system protein VirB10 [Gilliamella sp. W8126]
MTNKGEIVDIDDVKPDRNSINTGIKRNSKSAKSIFIVVAALILFIGLLMTIFNFDSNDKKEIEFKKDEALQSTNTLNNNSLSAQMEEIKRQQEEEKRKQLEAERQERLRKEKEERERLARQEEEERVLATINPKGTGTVNNSEGTGDQQMTIEERRFSGDTLVLLDTTKSGGERVKQQDGALNEMLAGGVYANGSATLMKNNRNLLLIHGTQIPCALQTRLVTDQPSILICQITKDIFSSDGSTLLIERGSKVFGEQKKAIITGQNMAFVNWSEIDTPHGVRVRIDSLGTDSLGASGVNIWVDEKWGKRFGGAIILSFIQDSISTASKAATKNKSSDTVVYENSERNSGRMAEIALENSISIQPTGYANQGQLINILVARDIDFSSIYTLRDK